MSVFSRLLIILILIEHNLSFLVLVTWMVSGSGVLDVSGMKVTRRAARRAITPNTTRGTWAPYILSSTINGAIYD